MKHQRPFVPRRPVYVTEPEEAPIIARHTARDAASAPSGQLAKPEATVPPLPERLLVKVAEAARLLSVSERTIYTLIAEGKLESRGKNRLRRITVASLRRYAEGEMED